MKMDTASWTPGEHLSLVVLLRAFYLAASALIVVIQALPPLRNRFLAYGSRATPSSSSSEAHARSRSPASPLARILDSLASITVPHNYFSHFYFVSVLSSLFWRWVYPEMFTAEWRTMFFPAPSNWGQFSITGGQIQLAWLLMLIQGTRRLFESSAYTASSKSRMWFGHWILGLLFYLTVNVAIWAEGMQRARITNSGVDEQSGQNFPWKHAILVPAILTAQAMQHSYHAYLYRLRTEHSTYQLPSHPLFPNLLCPHYTCEVTIYLLLSFLTSPTDCIVNWTMISVTIFVFVNLGVTAIGTKHWYVQRFGKEKVKDRRTMIPWIW